MNRKNLLFTLLGIFLVIGITAFTWNAAQADDIDDIYDKAKAAYADGNYEKSIQLYQDVLSMDKTHKEARLELGQSYIALEEYDPAIKFLNEGVYETPKVGEFYTILSEIYLTLQRVEEAYEILDKGMQYSKEDNVKKAMDELNASIYVDTSRQLVQEGFERQIALVWEDAEEKKHPLKAEWTNKDTSIGTLTPVEDEENLWMFSAEQTGRTTIHVSWASYEETVEFKVDDQVLDQVKIEPEEFENIEVEDTLTLSYTGLDEAGEEMKFKPVWSSSNQLFSITEKEDNVIELTGKENGTDNLKLLYLDYKETYPLTIGEDTDEEENTFRPETIGNGSVTVFPAKEHYEAGDEVTIEAFPDEGWEFIGWGGDFEGNTNPLNLTVEDEMNVIAHFEPMEHRLSLSIEGEGRIIRDSLATTYTDGETISLRARAKDGWEFVRWEGDVTGTERDINLEMIADKSVRAVFEETTEEETDSNTSDEDAAPTEPEPTPDPEPKPEPEPTYYQLSVGVNGNGKISKNPSRSQFKEGTEVQLTAQAHEGWIFTGWSGSSSSSSSSITVTMNGNKNIQANFEKKPEPKTYTLSTSVKGEGSVIPSKTTANDGETITIEAFPAEGWKFAGWSGDIQSNNRITSLTMNGNKQVTAIFEKIPE
ncbi:tetratricopeptide repeat protein [Halobacillus sp. Nhm2S1]|uniref:InlB B-repeat-containing protein n=1 Tax=Halobacillus sp. Nhm2S1 TaxID=2866716 RepID=UPI001C739794|nr:tetratricopeptide repeat protein [Halobacillus sp. Nhm2S1]MBX0357735.1 InlB B-repeat-containing protein [Halobacillus sp. Nhm2S1]